VLSKVSNTSFHEKNPTCHLVSASDNFFKKWFDTFVVRVDSKNWKVLLRCYSRNALKGRAVTASTSSQHKHGSPDPRIEYKNVECQIAPDTSTRTLNIERSYKSVFLHRPDIRRFRKTAKSVCYLRHVCSSVCPNGTTRLPLDGFR